MKKYLLILGIFLLIILGILIKVYVTAVHPIKVAENKAVSLAKEKGYFSEVNDFHVYHGPKKEDKTVDVIEGKNKKGEKVIVWIEEKSKKITVRRAKNGVSKKEAVQVFLKDQNPKKIISVRLGLIEKTPVWEIYYRSNGNLINYYYVNFDTGKWYKKYLNI
jgi:uncharacterized protein YpmB